MAPRGAGAATGAAVVLGSDWSAHATSRVLVPVRSDTLAGVVLAESNAPGLPFRCGGEVVDGATAAGVFAADLLGSCDPADLHSGGTVELNAALGSALGSATNVALASWQRPWVSFAVRAAGSGAVFALGSVSWSSSAVPGSWRCGARLLDVSAAVFAEAARAATGCSPQRTGSDASAASRGVVGGDRHRLIGSCDPFGFSVLDGSTEIPGTALEVCELDPGVVVLARPGGCGGCARCTHPALHLPRCSPVLELHAGGAPTPVTAQGLETAGR